MTRSGSPSPRRWPRTGRFGRCSSCRSRASSGISASPAVRFGCCEEYVRTGHFEVVLTHNRFTLVDRSAELAAESGRGAERRRLQRRALRRRIPHRGIPPRLLLSAGDPAATRRPARDDRPMRAPTASTWPRPHCISASPTSESPRRLSGSPGSSSSNRPWPGWPPSARRADVGAGRSWPRGRVAGSARTGPEPHQRSDQIHHQTPPDLHTRRQHDQPGPAADHRRFPVRR